MDKKLTAKEMMELTNQLIEREMVRSGRTYKEVSQEFRAKLKARTEQKERLGDIASLQSASGGKGGQNEVDSTISEIAKELGQD